MRLTVPAIALVTSATALSMSVAAAQTAVSSPPSAPARSAPAFKNLQVFPKDIARPDLIANMRFFSQSLGVRCTYCHVGVEGQPPSTYDFASDAKKEKMIARKMLLMVHRINQQDFAVTDFNKAKVTCFTCHRGAQHPLTAPPPAPAGAAPASPPAPATNPAPAKAAERG